MKILFGILIVLFTGVSLANCQNAILKGEAPQFADDFLIIKKITNPITGESSPIDTLQIDDTGNFIHEINIKKAGWIYIKTGIFQLTLFIKPGIVYEINLPPKTKKSEADIRNPFYKPLIASIIVKKEYPVNDESLSLVGIDINTKIFQFDTLITFRNNEMLLARRDMKSYNSDSLISSTEKYFQSDTSNYFKQYRNFRYGIIKINSRDIGLQHIFEQYLKSEIPLADNPAYMDLFNEMYEEFIFFYSRTDEGNSINYLVNRTQNLKALKDTLMKHPAIPNRIMAEFIIIKEIYDIYFNDYFYREALLSLLDSIISKPETEQNRIYASGVKNYLTRLKTGERPPDFNLLDQNNNLRTLDDFRGKYVYINFCTPDNYSCLKEFPFLNALYKVHDKHLEIVTIMVTEEIHNMKDFMKKNKYSWTSLFYGNDDKLLQNYDVKAYPTSYLIDPEGKMIQSPATLATEGFEEQLFRIMKSRGDL